MRCRRFFVHLFFVHFFLYITFLNISFLYICFVSGTVDNFFFTSFFCTFFLIWQFSRGDLLYAGTADGATLVQPSGKEISVSVCHDLLSVAHEQVTIHISYFTDFIDVAFFTWWSYTLLSFAFVYHELLCGPRTGGGNSAGAGSVSFYSTCLFIF